MFKNINGPNINVQKHRPFVPSVHVCVSRVTALYFSLAYQGVRHHHYITGRRRSKRQGRGGTAGNAGSSRRWSTRVNETQDGGWTWRSAYAGPDMRDVMMVQKSLTQQT